MKALPDDKINVTLTLKFVSERIVNVLGKGENAGDQHFLLFTKCFQKPFSLGSLKVGIVWKRVKNTLDNLVSDQNKSALGVAFFQDHFPSLALRSLPLS